MTNLKDVELGNLLIYGDMDELKEAKEIIEEEIRSRNKKVYEDCVNNILIAINDLIDNGFGNEFFGIESDGNWKDLRDDIKANYSCL